jgi:hypothetical protein
LTSETFDYTNGESSITTFNPNGTSSTTYYSGPNGTGSVISGLTSSTAAGIVTSPAAAGGVSTTAAVSQADASSDSTVILVTGSNQLIDPGMGNHTIQFATAASADTLVLHSVGSDQILGFDPALGDTLDFNSLLGEAHLSIGQDMSQLGNYLSVVNSNGSAAILFDPTGHGGGSPVALLVNNGSLVATLQTLLKSFET